MKLVLTKAEVAEALAVTVDDLDRDMPSLLRLGFPAPVIGLVDRWPIMGVMNWINRAQNEGHNGFCNTVGTYHGSVQ
jgi:hypothetical protein